MTPMKLNRAYPVAALHDYVRCSRQREADIQGAAVAYSIAARPDQILGFYLRQPYMVRDCKSGSQDVAPSAVVVGPCTYRRIATCPRAAAFWCSPSTFMRRDFTGSFARRCTTRWTCHRKIVSGFTN